MMVRRASQSLCVMVFATSALKAQAQSVFSFPYQRFEAPATHVVSQEKLGPGDGIEVSLPSGRIVVIASDLNEVRYTLQQVSVVPFFSPYNIPTPRYEYGVNHESGTGIGIHLAPSAFWVDTTARRALRPYTGSFQENLVPFGLRLTLPSLPLTSSYTIPPGDKDTTVVNPAIREFFKRLAADSGIGDGIEVRIEVPRTLARLRLDVSGAGAIVVQDFEGELTATIARGPVILGHLGGAALVEATNGDITATFSHTKIENPISLMSGKGIVEAWFPVGTNAQLTLSSWAGGTLRSTTLANTMEFFNKPATATDPKTGRVAHARLGTGGTNIRLESLAGDVWLETVAKVPRWPEMYTPK